MTKNNNAFSLAGKKGLILGLANENSIAWGCTQLAHQMGAELVVSCLNDKARRFVEPLTAPLGVDLVGCNVEEDGELQALVARAAQRLGQLDFVIHSIAWAPMDDLHGQVIDSSRKGFSRAMEVSCHSFAELARLCVPHMAAGGSLLSMTYLGADGAGKGRARIAGALHGAGAGPAGHSGACRLARPHPHACRLGHRQF